MKNRPPARFNGVRIHTDPDGVFKVRHALNWSVFDLPAHPGGFLCSPYAETPQTWVAVWKEDIGEIVRAADRKTLRDGLDEGLTKLGKNVQVLSATEDLIGDMIRFERILTFEQDGITHKCRQWVIFAHNYQIVLIYQAENEEEFDYWLAMANYSFFTFELSEMIFFLTDPDQPQKRKEAQPVKKGKEKRTNRI